jgi:D-alanyl-D-alanine carboxypeptidase
MQKRILPIILILSAAILVIVGTTTEPFRIMVTMAQQFTDSNTREITVQENQDIQKNPEGEDQNNNQETEHNNVSQPEIPEENKENNPYPQDSQLAYDKTTTVDAQGRQFVTNADSLLVLVTKKRNIPADYKPKNMVIPDVKFSFPGESPKKYLREEAARALEELFQAAQKEGLNLLATSGYRSYETQKKIFETKAKAIGEKAANLVSAYPGQSEHQTGLAMDVTCSSIDFGLEESFGATKEGIWVKDNAHKYGFIVRYPKGKESITGYIYEPWHIRFVGKEVAGYLFDNDLTLDEYFAEIYDYSI